MTSDLEDIVRNHYDPSMSREAHQPLFMVEDHSRSANHAIAVLDAREFAEWLKHAHQSELLGLTIEQLVDEIKQAALIKAKPKRSHSVHLTEHDEILPLLGGAILLLWLIWILR